MQTHDPYTQYIKVLDTDYDNYLILYNCHDELI